MSVKPNIPSYAEGLKKLRESFKGVFPDDAVALFDKDAKSLEATYTSITKLKAGDLAPDFSLPNATNETVTLSDLLKHSRIVLTFYRGTWCPYCNLQLAQYQQVLDEIKSLGAQLVAISPQIPDESLNIKEKNELKFEVLSDMGNMVASKYTTTFKYADIPLEKIKELGINFDSHYSDDSNVLPIPAVFIIEKDGTVTFAKAIGGDYRNRVEAKEILQALKN